MLAESIKLAFDETAVLVFTFELSFARFSERRLFVETRCCFRSFISIRYFNHHLCTYKQTKVALTSLYDKFKFSDNSNNVPYGYNPSNEIAPEEPDVEPDADDILNGEPGVLMEEILRAIG